MNSGLVNKKTISDIANAIRVKRHSDIKMYPKDMANEITKIDNVSKEGTYAGNIATYSDAATLGFLRGDNVSSIPTENKTVSINTSILSDRNNSLAIQLFANGNIFANANEIKMPKYVSRMFADINQMSGNYGIPDPYLTPPAYYDADFSNATNMSGFCYDMQARIHNITIPNKVTDMSFAYYNCHLINIMPREFNQQLLKNNTNSSNWVFHNVPTNYYYAVEPTTGVIINCGSNYSAVQKTNGYKKGTEYWCVQHALGGWCNVVDASSYWDQYSTTFMIQQSNISTLQASISDTVELPCGNNVINMAYAYAKTNPYFYNQTLPYPGYQTSPTDAYREGTPKFLYTASSGDNVVNMSHAYYKSCLTPTIIKTGSTIEGAFYWEGNRYINRGLVGSAACGPKVENLSYAYAYCNGLNSAPNCGPSVTDASYAFYGCLNLSTMGNAFLGNNVQNTAYMYFGSSLATISGDIYFNWSDPNNNSATLVNAEHMLYRWADINSRLNIHFKQNSAWHNWFNNINRAFSFMSYAPGGYMDGSDCYYDDGDTASDYSLVQSSWNQCFYFTNNAYNIYFYYDL